ncbi:MAG: DoxX family protein [Nitrospirota bacterium]
MLKALLKTDNNIVSLVLRLTLGGVIFAHGARKVLGWFGGAGAVKTILIFNESLGFSAPLSLLVMAAEFLGSIALVFGLFTRISALAIAVNIGVCAYMNHLKNGFFMNWFGQQKGEGFEFHILIVGIALALIIKGGGALSLDRGLTRETVTTFWNPSKDY